MQVAVLRLFHESNTFCPVVADSKAFRVRRGDAVLATHGSTPSVISGFKDGAAGEGMQLVGLMSASSRGASPPANARDLHPANRIGVMTAEAYDSLTTEMCAMLRAGPPGGGTWDGVLIGCHGAAVSELHPDCDGAFCSQVRECVGEEAVIGVCLDMHANVSPLLVHSTDVCVVWRTTPHVDMHARARRTAQLVAQAIRGETHPVQWIEKPPLVVNVTKHFTDVDPMHSVCNDCMTASDAPGVLDASVALGSPYCDVEHMGMAFIVIADGNLAAAKQTARWMASRAWCQRRQLCTPGPARAYGSPPAPASTAVTPELTAEGAVMAADQLYRGPKPGRADEVEPEAMGLGPVVVLDVGDNIGGGSPGDSTFLLHAAIKLGCSGFLQSLVDPEAVRVCMAAGVGGLVRELAVGGKNDLLHGESVLVSGVVTGLSNGEWWDTGPVHGGRRHFSAGDCASILVAEGRVTLALTSMRCDNSSRGLFHQLGIRPEEQRVVVAKGVEAPRATFEPIAAALLMSNTPGITSADMTSFSFKHRRSLLFPFEEHAELATADLSDSTGKG